MHRIVKHIVSLSVSAVFVGAFVSACAKAEPTYESSAFSTGCVDCGPTGCCLADVKKCGVLDTAGMCKPKEGECIEEYCPDMGAGFGCCVNASTCGINLGMGCVPITKDAG